MYNARPRYSGGMTLPMSYCNHSTRSVPATLDNEAAPTNQSSNVVTPTQSGLVKVALKEWRWPAGNARSRSS
eukprot:2884337-Amphidinium_carterae.1